MFRCPQMLFRLRAMPGHIVVVRRDKRLLAQRKTLSEFRKGPSLKAAAEGC
jgi:hypothetical protein